MAKIADRILDKIYSFYINYKVFDKNVAKRLPIYMSHNVKCKGLYKGCIDLKADKIYKGMLQIGFGRISPGIEKGRKSYINIIGSGKMCFAGKADLSMGISLNVYNNALLTIGSGIYANGYCSIQCKEKITIGKDNMWGWNVEIIDGDGHPILNEEGKIVNPNKAIQIGDDVWLGANSKVLKGSNIKNGCIVGFGSVVVGENQNSNSILVGYPATEIKYGIKWCREELFSNQEHDNILYK